MIISSFSLSVILLIILLPFYNFQMMNTFFFLLLLFLLYTIISLFSLIFLVFLPLALCSSMNSLFLKYSLIYGEFTRAESLSHVLLFFNLLFLKRSLLTAFLAHSVTQSTELNSFQKLYYIYFNLYYFDFFGNKSFLFLHC